MAKRIIIIQGHPDPADYHLGHGLAGAYTAGALAAGHEVQSLAVAKLDFPLLRTKIAYETEPPPAAIVQAQALVRWADHLVILFPLWAGTMPALLKGFFEQVFRPGFAVADDTGRLPRRLLQGKSARIIVTMGMPVWVYRWYFRAHGVKNLQRNILGLCGVHPIKVSWFGAVDTADKHRREQWLRGMHRCGEKAC